MTTLSTSAMLREQLASAHEELAAVMADVTGEQAHWAPPGKVHPVGALYAHVLLYEDLILNFMVRGQTPLFLGEWAGKVGVSELPPLPNPETGGVDWSAWARSTAFDLERLHEYGRAVSAASDATLAALDEAALASMVDLGWLGLGHRSLRWVVSRFVIGHADAHLGEISCIKGLQGLRGYAI